MATSPTPVQEGWHLDRRIPITLIFVIILQTAGIVWTAARMQSAIETNTLRIAQLEARASETIVLSERFGRLEEQMRSVSNGQEQMVTWIRRLSDRIETRDGSQ